MANSPDPQIKELAAKALPVIKEHLTMAQSIGAKIGAAPSGYTQ